MIAYLRGKFTHKTPASVIIDCNGVGYDVHISLNTYSRIQGTDEGALLIHMLVREDAHILYGFFDAVEKGLFLQLIGVSGVGASTARVMLSYMKPEELSAAIVQGNARTLEAIKGIGKKTAERIVVELRDRLAKQPLDVNISLPQSNTAQTDALNALIALGINRIAAEGAIKKAYDQNPDLSVEDLVKTALKNL
jgi:holliday junction DNA helicase RuvA